MGSTGPEIELHPVPEEEISHAVWIKTCNLQHICTLRWILVRLAVLSLYVHSTLFNNRKFC